MRLASNQADAGYTLLELLVVIAIIALAVLSAPTAYGLIVPNFQARQFANDLANTARDLRRDAIREQRITSLQYVPDAKRVVSTDRVLEVPVTLDVTFSRQMAWASSDDNEVEFYPSGGASGGVFEITRDNIRVAVKIDWVTGAVEVQQ